MRAFIGSPVKISNEIEVFLSDLSKNNIRIQKSLHITYNFFGNLDDKSAVEIGNKISLLKYHSIISEISEITCFPSMRRPSVIVMLPSNEDIKILHDKIISILPPNLIENRKFIPHITIARIKRNINNFEIKKENIPGKVVISKVCLYQSILEDSGAIHREISCIDLSKL